MMIMVAIPLRSLRNSHLVIRHPWKVAALAYAAYGVVYFFGAASQLTPDRQHDFYGVPWWAFFVVGAALVAVCPVLVWKRYRRFTQVLSVFPAIKAATLLMKQGKLMGAGEPTILYNWFFALVALMASVMLFRVAFGSKNVSSEQ
jgi:hypothetical protein